MREQETQIEMKRVSWEPGQGVLCYMKGATMPMKVFASPNAIFAVNLVKRMIVEGMKVLFRPYFLLAWLS